MDRIILNDKFRIKLTDRCNLSCPFCHAEGGRRENDLVIGQTFISALELLRPLYSRVHLTGGEPLLYQHLDSLMEILEGFGLKIAMTTNGQFLPESRLAVLKRLEYINVSVHSFRREYVERLTSKGQNPDQVIASIKRNLVVLSQIIPVRINTVVSGDRELQAVEEILEFAAAQKILVKLVPEWSARDSAEKAIKGLLDERGFVLCQTQKLFPGSNVRMQYRDPSGQTVEVKRISFFQPDFLCGSCREKAKCQEGFSFLRIGGEPLYFQPCIFGDKLGVETFRRSVLPHLYELFQETRKICN